MESNQDPVRVCRSNPCLVSRSLTGTIRKTVRHVRQPPRVSPTFPSTDSPLTWFLGWLPAVFREGLSDEQITDITDEGGADRCQAGEADGTGPTVRQDRD